MMTIFNYSAGLISNARSITVDLVSTVSNFFYPDVDADFGGSVILEGKINLAHNLANNKNKGVIDKILNT